MELLEQNHCHPKEELGDCVGKVLLLNPDLLLTHQQRVENQVWLAISGVGCYMEDDNHTIRAISLHKTQVESIFQRKEFLGELKEEYLPDFARKSREKVLVSFANSDDMER